MIASPFAYRVSLATIAVLFGLAGGCACPGSPGGWCGHHGGEYFAAPLPICFGYTSTCWHPWPAECVVCPTPFGPEGIDAVPVSKPLAESPVQAYESPMPVEPPMQATTPMPPETYVQPPAPQPEERGHYEPPASQAVEQVHYEPPPPQPEEQVHYEPPPPVLTVAPVVTPASLGRVRPVIDGSESP